MRKMVLLMLAAVLALSPAAAAFEAIPSGHWAAAAVEDLHAQGVLIGYPDGTFRGANPATRYELAIALKRLENVVRGLAATTRVAGLSEGTAESGSRTEDLEAIKTELAALRTMVDSLAQAVREDGQQDARRDKALNDLSASLLALQQNVKASQVRVDKLEKLVEEFKTRLSTLDELGAFQSRLDQSAEENRKLKAEVTQLKGEVTQLKGEVTQLKGEVTQLKGEVTQQKAAFQLDPLRSRLDQLAEENSKLKAEVSQQKATLQRMYWLIAGAAVLGIAVK
jgi:predicted  nucleic acid-binding Zn-ribbon protein